MKWFKMSLRGKRDRYRERYGGLESLLRDVETREFYLQEELKRRRLSIGIPYTLDTSWSMKEFKDALEKIDWENVFPPEREVYKVVNQITGGNAL